MMRFESLFTVLAVFLLNILNPTSPNEFHSSTNQIVHQSNIEYQRIAQQLAELIKSDAELQNVTCYQLITAAFEHGIRHEWSSKLITATSFLPETLIQNLMREQYTELGDYRQCLSLPEVPIEHVLPNSTEIGHFNGRYCLVKLIPNELNSTSIGNFSTQATTEYSNIITQEWLRVSQRFPLINGICAPSNCDAAELKLLIKKYFASYLTGIQVDVDYCQPDSSGLSRFSFGYYVSSCLLIMAVFLSIMGSAVFSFKRFQWLAIGSNPSNLLLLLNCFNLERNLSILLKVPAQCPDSYDIRFFNFYKTFFVLLVVGSHGLIFLPTGWTSPIVHFRRYFSSNREQLALPYIETAFSRAGLLMDNFFIINGFIVAYYSVRNLTKLPNFVLYLVIRWIRLVPAVIVYHCLTILLQSAGTGPLFHPKLTQTYVEPCENNWWQSLLMIQNVAIRNERSICGPHLWFVATDFQLYVLFYPILIIYFRFRESRYRLPALACCALIGGALIGQLIIFIMDISEPFDYSFFQDVVKPSPKSSIIYFYTSPLTRILPYFTGVILVLSLTRSKTPTLTNKPYQTLLNWTLFSLNVACFFIPFPLRSTHSKSTYFYGYFIIYCTNCVITYVYCREMIIQQMTTNKAALSAHYWTVLSRLSYGIYIVHPALIWYHLASIQQTPYLSGMYQAMFIVSIYMQSLILSVCLFLFVEAPCVNLGKLLVAKHLPKS